MSNSRSTSTPSRHPQTHPLLLQHRRQHHDIIDRNVARAGPLCNVNDLVHQRFGPPYHGLVGDRQQDLLRGVRVTIGICHWATGQPRITISDLIGEPRMVGRAIAPVLSQRRAFDNLLLHILAHIQQECFHVALEREFLGEYERCIRGCTLETVGLPLLKELVHKGAQLAKDTLAMGKDIPDTDGQLLRTKHPFLTLFHGVQGARGTLHPLVKVEVVQQVVKITHWGPVQGDVEALGPTTRTVAKRTSIIATVATTISTVVTTTTRRRPRPGRQHPVPRFFGVRLLYCTRTLCRTIHRCLQPVRFPLVRVQGIHFTFRVVEFHTDFADRTVHVLTVVAVQLLGSGCIGAHEMEPFTQDPIVIWVCGGQGIQTWWSDAGFVQLRFPFGRQLWGTRWTSQQRLTHIVHGQIHIVHTTRAAFQQGRKGQRRRRRGTRGARVTLGHHRGERCGDGIVGGEGDWAR